MEYCGAAGASFCCYEVGFRYKDHYYGYYYYYGYDYYYHHFYYKVGTGLLQGRLRGLPHAMGTNVAIHSGEGYKTPAAAVCPGLPKGLK